MNEPLNLDEVTFEEDPQYTPLRAPRPTPRPKPGITGRLVNLGLVRDEDMARKVLLGIAVLLFLLIIGLIIAAELRNKAAKKLNTEPQGIRIEQL